MIILETIELSKTYGTGENPVHALANVSFQIHKGEFVTIVGPSGSGKSTLLHMLGGLDVPTKGKVIINGTDMYALPEHELSLFRRRELGFIFQSFNLIPILTAEENICLPVLLDGLNIETAYLDHLLRLLDLQDRRGHLPNELSGGQQQRVAIARALANKPSIILADEPTGNLDSKNRLQVLELLKSSIRSFDQTLVLITHDPEVADHADRIIKIEDGVITNDVKTVNV
ncbi:ABC transporter ATP-binding protein [Paenibacillus oleatilyticus]|uniref:ABC transporter ATP-binding protein n=1 Tax=Paenibacillus oleatilyticus TaxID=2594886 RepID=UPI001C1F6C98|nr:ABC transporter ATP-binding protein [Paenibacillus oleatilyticus]MBU7318325.1 ABC transporter ATP-binding protein [Paenibacillus oleatilyticus]